VADASGNDGDSWARIDLAPASGIRIEWSDSAANVGIDQINFTVTPVPEPGAAALPGIFSKWEGPVSPLSISHGQAARVVDSLDLERSEPHGQIAGQGPR
jgi:hypothetical protein